MTYTEARAHLFAKLDALADQPPVFWPKWTIDDYTALVAVLHTTEED